MRSPCLCVSRSIIIDVEFNCPYKTEPISLPDLELLLHKLLSNKWMSSKIMGGFVDAHSLSFSSSLPQGMAGLVFCVKLNMCVLDAASCDPSKKKMCFENKINKIVRT